MCACVVESAVRGLLTAASERGRGAARASLFIKELSYAAVATVAAPAADGKAPSPFDLSSNRPTFLFHH